MPRQLHVFGMRGVIRTSEIELAPESIRSYLAERSHVRQTREIVTATSRAAAGRAFDVPPHHFDAVCLSSTGNVGEIVQAMSEPGVVFWRPLDYRGEDWGRRDDVT